MLRLALCNASPARGFSTSAVVLARTNAIPRPPIQPVKIKDWENAASEELKENDTPSLGHKLLEQQRKTLHYLRLIDNEMPSLVDFRVPFDPSYSSPLIVRSIEYLGEEHPASNKRTVVIPVARLPLKGPHAMNNFKVLAGPRWSIEPPKDSGFGMKEPGYEHGFFKMACEDFPKPAMNLKWTSDVIDRLIMEANSPKCPAKGVPVDTRHLDAKKMKAKNGEHHSLRKGRPTIHDFPKEWLPAQPAQAVQPCITS